MIEEWREIKGYEGLYEVSSLGNIRSCTKMARSVSKRGRETFNIVRGRILKMQNGSGGYVTITISKNGKTKTHSVHRLVAVAFLENTDNLPEVNHKDGNKKNNTVFNLEWCSGSRNKSHAYSSGIRKTGKRHHFSSLPRSPNGHCMKKKMVESIYPIEIETV